jgi:hypothetical protein
MQRRPVFFRHISRVQDRATAIPPAGRSDVSIMTSIPAIGVDVEEEHDPFPDEQPFHFP